MNPFPQFPKQNLLLALEKIKENKALFHLLFNEQAENNDFYTLTLSYLEQLEEGKHYTFAELLPVLQNEGAGWHLWYRKTLILTFLAQYTLRKEVSLDNPQFIYPGTLFHDIRSQYNDKKGRLKSYTTVIDGDLYLKEPMVVAGDLEVKGNLYLSDNGETQAELIVLGSLICRKKIEKLTWAGTHIICGRDLEAKSIALYSNYLGVGRNLNSKAIFMDTNDNTVQVLGNVTMRLGQVWQEEAGKRLQPS